jgi:glutamate--cysteine ligase catalytic subunit
MEIQLTDFENAAYSVFIALLSKAILKFKPDFYIPILHVDENMETAHKVDSVSRINFGSRHHASGGSITMNSLATT